MSRKTKASLGIAISSIAAVGGIMTPQTALAEEGTGATAQPQAASQNVTVADNDLGQQTAEAKQEYEQAQATADADVTNVTTAREQKDAADAATDAARAGVDDANKAVSDTGSAAQQAIDDAKKGASDAAESDAAASRDAEQRASEAQGEKDAADADVTDAQANADKAQQAYAEADKDAGSVTQEDAKKADDAADAAKDAADADGKALDAAEREANDASDAEIAAKSDEESAQGKLDEASKGLDAANAERDKARDALDAAQKALDAAKKAAESSQPSSVTDAMDALAKANDALAAARAAQHAADADASKADEALAQAQSAYDTAKKDLDDAVTRQSAASKTLKDAQDKLASLQGTAFADADAGKEAQSKIDAARDALAAATKQLDDDKSALASAKEALDSAQKALDAAPAADADVFVDANRTIANSSLGFFEWLAKLDANNEGAIKVLTDSQWTGTDTTSEEHETFLSDTHIGNADDATSLENLRKSILYIIAGNKYRANDEIFTEEINHAPLKVSTLLMAQAEVNANWMWRHFISGTPHAEQNGEPWKNGENAAGGWKFTNYEYDPSDGDDDGTDNGDVDLDSPYDAWYLMEKYNWIHEVIKQDYKDEKYKSHNDWQIGHYLNLMSAQYWWTTTGFGLCTAPGTRKNNEGIEQNNAVQTFGGKNGMEINGTLLPTVIYDADDFLAMFDRYYAAVKRALAQDAVNAAQSERDAAQSSVDKAQADVTARQDELAQAQSAYETAKEAYAAQQSTLQEKVNVAQAESDAADEAVRKAQADVDNAKDALATAQDAADKAAEAKAAADATVSTAETQVNTAKAAYDDAVIAETQDRLDAAKEKLSDAKQRQSDADGTLAKASDAQKSAADAYAAAEDALATAKSKAAEAKAAADAAQKAYDDAVNGATTPSVPFDETEAGKAATQAVTDAKARVNEANATLADAKATLDAANATLAKGLEGTGVTQAMIDAIDQDETLANSSYGFFKWLGSMSGDSNKNALALKFLTDAAWTGKETRNGSEVGTFLSYTHIGQEDDATSLKNLGDAIKLIAAGNQYRANDDNFNVQPLKVSTLLMALAEINANWNGRDSAQQSAHAINVGERNRLSAYGENQAAIGSTWKDNAGWSELGYDASDGDDYGTNNGKVDWDTPYDAWYLGERYNWIHKNVLKDTSDTTKYHAFNSGVTGHYTNLMGWSKGGVTGLAVSEYGDGTWYHSNAMQEFSYENARVSDANGNEVSNADMGVYDVAEFQRLYDQYVKALAARKGVISAKSDVAKAQQAYDDADASAKSAQSALDTAQKAYDDAKTAYGETASHADIDGAKATLDAANAALAKANDAVTSAQDTADKAQEASTQANAALTKAQAEKDAADDAVTKATAELAQAQSDYDAARQGTSSSETPVQRAQAAVDEARKALDDANAKLAEAKEAYDAAKTASEAATSKHADAQARLDKAKKALAEATDKAKASSEEYAKANAEAERIGGLLKAKDEAAAALDVANAKLAESKRKAQDASDKLDKARRAYDEAAEKARDSAAAYDAIKDYTVDDVMAGKPGLPDSVVTAVKDAMQRNEEAQGRLDEARKAYEKALDDANDANAAYNDALAKHQRLEEAAMSAKERYLELLARLTQQQQGKGHDGSHGTTTNGSGTQDGTASRGTTGHSTGRTKAKPYRVLGERVSSPSGRQASHGTQWHRAYGEPLFVGNQEDEGTLYGTNGNVTEAPTAKNDDTGSVMTSSDGNGTSGKHGNGGGKASTKPKSDATGTPHGDDDGNGNMPVIITSVIGGIVVVTVVAAGLYRIAKDKDDDKDDVNAK